MRYHALAADYDGTLADAGVIADETWVALKRLRETGRKLLMVTGRELDDVLLLLPFPEVFDRIVAENGALVYEPATKQVRTACPAPPPAFADELRRRGVDNVSVGRVIVATRQPHEDVTLHVIRDLGLELQVIFNKGAVMVLPSGVNKATGLARALEELELSPHNVVGIGDAENDHALLELCEAGVAVANALPALKEHADWVTSSAEGAGVRELMEEIIGNDLAHVPSHHPVRLGRATDGSDVAIDPYAANIMVCGTSGGGKSTLTIGLLERLSEAGYQLAIIDPEGDYNGTELAVELGSPHQGPNVTEVLDVLRDPKKNVAVNMLGVAVAHRPELFAKLMPSFADLRMRTGRPHWLVVDEAHHLLPATWEPIGELGLRRHGTLYVTVEPDTVAREVAKTIDTLITIGERVDETILEMCKVAGLRPPAMEATGKLPSGTALYWKVGSPRAIVVETEPPRTERKRHSRKYAEGNLGTRRSFYFRGPDGKLNLRAQNLQIFVQLAEGVDEDTWRFHADRHDYSSWLRNEVKDAGLADEVEELETRNAARDAFRAAIEKRYTVPADNPSGLVDEASP